MLKDFVQYLFNMTSEQQTKSNYNEIGRLIFSKHNYKVTLSKHRCSFEHLKYELILALSKGVRLGHIGAGPPLYLR